MEENIHNKRKKFKFPSAGVKNWKSEGTQVENDEIHRTLSEYKRLLEDPATRNKTSMLEALWIPHLQCAQITKYVGKYLETFGHAENSVILLYPEEALFLVEMNSLILQFGDKPLTRQECYRVLLDTTSTCNFTEYRTYRHLLINGFKLFRINRNSFISVNSREHDLREKILYNLHNFISSLSVENLNVLVEDKFINKHAGINYVTPANRALVRIADENNLIKTESLYFNSQVSVERGNEYTNKLSKNVFNRFMEANNIHEFKRFPYNDVSELHNILINTSCDNLENDEFVPIDISNSYNNDRESNILSVQDSVRIDTSSVTDKKPDKFVPINISNSSNIDVESNILSIEDYDDTNDEFCELFKHYNTAFIDMKNANERCKINTSNNDNFQLNSVPVLRIFYNDHMLQVESGTTNLYGVSNMNVELTNFYPPSCQEYVKNITTLVRDYNNVILKLKSALSTLEVDDILKSAGCNECLNTEIKDLLKHYFSKKLMKEDVIGSDCDKCTTSSTEIQNTIQPLLDKKYCLDYADTLKKLQIFREIDYTTIDASRYFEKVKYDVYLGNTKFPKTDRPKPHYRLMIFEENEQLPSTTELKAVLTKFKDEVPLLFAIVYPDKIALLLACSVLTPVLLD